MNIQEFAAGDVKLLDGDFTVAGKIGIMAGLSETILAEGTLTADLNSSSSAEVTLSTITTDAADGDEATGDVNSDLLFGVYTVAENENVTGLSIEEFAQSGVKDIYGNTMTTLTVPQTGNIDDNSTINIDAAASNKHDYWCVLQPSNRCDYLNGHELHHDSGNEC